MGAAQRGGEEAGPGSGAHVSRLRSAGEQPAGAVGARGSRGGDLQLAIDQLRHRVDEEFRISERLDAKARGAFALAAGFFAVIQTVAGGGLADDALGGWERGVLVGLAIVAGAAVLGAAYLLVRGIKLMPEDDLRPDAIKRWVEEAGDDEYVPGKLVSGLVTVAENRHTSNKARAEKYRELQCVVVVAVVVTSLELLWALLVRL